MKSKYLSIVSASAVGLVAALAVLGGVASISSAASGGPTVTLTSIESSSTSATTIPVTATFSEGVGALASTSITATNATVGTVSGSGTTFTFDLTPTAQGQVTVMLSADAALSVASSTGSQASNMLTFTYTPAGSPVITTQPQSQTITAGDQFNLQVGLSDTTGAHYQWFHNGTAISGNDLTQYTVATSTSADAGDYYVVVTNANGTATSSTATMTVNSSSGGGTGTSTVPVISNLIVSNIGANGATVSWNTDASSTDQVFYGATSGYGSMSTMSTTSSTTHSVMLSNLTENTTYHFMVESTNTGGNATSTDMTFSTLTTASTTPLSLTGVDTVRGNAIADGNFADGWEWVLHLTVPDTESNFAMKFNDFTTTSSSSTIPAMNNIRIWTQQSSNASTTASSMTESGNGYSADMTLNGDTSTSTPGRQIDVHVQVAVPTGTPVGDYSTVFGALSTTTPF